MSGNAFFGEVNELDSRAIYWSDEDTDDDAAGDETNGESQKKTTDVTVVVKIDDKLNDQLDVVYVCLAKDHKSSAAKDLTQIGHIVVDGIADKVANIYSTGQTSIWVQLLTNHTNLKNHLLVKTVSSLLRQVISRCRSQPLVCIVSKDLSREEDSDDYIGYLTTDESNLKIMPSDISRRPLLAPKMLDNLVESSVFEYCIVYGIPCTALILPQLPSKLLDNNKTFIPKAIVDCVHYLNNQHFDSNIYI
ncbi:uncharacterized protein LOC128964684 [Oppia nitens]|uniref:uncharacterized protein LOC128964684 n=1 Tax=Oppia nitens TaxID=1686743 RepID=UPI0023DA1059|nr:uncharacterized protein LOC128964684 [Oppia nitens]